jgi:hypothetical protein
MLLSVWVVEVCKILIYITYHGLLKRLVKNINVIEGKVQNLVLE